MKNVLVYEEPIDYVLPFYDPIKNGNHLAPPTEYARWFGRFLTKLSCLSLNNKLRKKAKVVKCLGHRCRDTNTLFISKYEGQRMCKHCRKDIIKALPVRITAPNYGLKLFT